MLESWAIASACCTSGAVWLWYWSPTRVLPGEEAAHELPMPLVLEMLAVAIRRGASIPHALIVVGRIVGGDFGEGLSSVGGALNQGVDWDQAWPSGDFMVKRGLAAEPIGCRYRTVGLG